MEPRGTQRGAKEALEAPKGGPKGGKRVTGGSQEGYNEGGKSASRGPTRAPKGSKRGPRGSQGGTRWAKRAPRGGGSQRAQEGLKGVPQSELDDCYTVSEGPEGGLKGKNLQKLLVFEHS